MLVRGGLILDLLSKVFTPWQRICLLISARVTWRVRSHLRDFEKLECFWKVERSHPIFLESQMNNAYIVEIHLRVHLFALKVDLVLLWVCFLLVVATLVRLLYIAARLFFSVYIKWLHSFEVISTSVFKHGFCMTQKTHLLLASNSGQLSWAILSGVLRNARSMLLSFL